MSLGSNLVKIDRSSISASQIESIRALSNMAQAVEASEMRAEQACDETIATLQNALKESENNCETVSERNAQLAAENFALQKQLRELRDSNRVQIQALEAQWQAKFKMTLDQLVPTCDKIIESINVIAEKSIEQCVPGLSSCSNIGWRLALTTAYMNANVQEQHAPGDIKKAREGVIFHAKMIKSQIAQIAQQKDPLKK